MEKKLVKIALYTFVISFSVFIVFIEQDRTVKTGNGLYTGLHLELPDYILMLIRYSIKTTFVVFVVVILIEYIKRKRK
ncbi:hypothetical protein NDK47_17550 [Brevibacillus ruminantium]|uniref:Group-specific protein n=1 Tax=Brevibacillus ruminantium TaxID=2950604 RepID=A0ABY4WDV0_9BACL|nr:hypothetical protein [Brevibacillus ruminantium]USG63955.1 hypothetical protein NDK47_17550 [Brevibacillus ruminantium]